MSSSPTTTTTMPSAAPTAFQLSSPPVVPMPQYGYDAFQFSPHAPTVMFVFTALVFVFPIIFYCTVMARYCCDSPLKRELRLPSLRKRESTAAVPAQVGGGGGATPQPDDDDDDMQPSRKSAYEILLTFRSLTYTVPDALVPGRKKVLLDDVTGYFAPGTLNALVGPSGSGKSTLLSILADTQNGGTWSGDIRVNGRPRGPTFRKNAAYVVQNDRLFESLTIRETLWFAVELRTRIDVKSSVKREIVRDVLSDLDLAKWNNVRCGKLSGGQKRRVTVALELVARPSLIFLDEPTSGLDGSGALALVRVLRRLADKRKTVICTIHQPRIDAFMLFDRVHMLSAGKTVYFGTVADITTHFRDHLKDHGGDADDMNPADFLLDLTHSAETSKGLDTLFAESQLCRDLLAMADAEHNRPPASSSSNGTLSEDDHHTLQDNMDLAGGKYVTTQFKQIVTLLRRALINDTRSSAYLMQWVLGIIMMLFMGMLYSYVDDPNVEGLYAVGQLLNQWGACTQNITALSMITNTSLSTVDTTLRTCGQSTQVTLELVHARMSLLYQLLAGAFFSEMPQVAAIYEDRGSYFREHASRCYSTSSWIWFWIIKITFSGFVKGIIFPPFVYFSAHLVLDPVGYFFFGMFLALMSIAGGAIALFAVVATETFETATVSFVIVSLLTQNLSGYWIPLGKIGWWFRWLAYINFLYGGDGRVVCGLHLSLTRFNNSFYSYQGVVMSQYLDSNTETSFLGNYANDLNFVFVALIVTMGIIFVFFLLTWLLAWSQGRKVMDTETPEEEEEEKEGCCNKCLCTAAGIGGLRSRRQREVSIRGDLAFHAKAAAAGTPALTFG